MLSVADPTHWLPHLCAANALPGVTGTIFDYWVPQTRLPTTASYVALGHIHRQQSVCAAHRLVQRIAA